MRECNCDTVKVEDLMKEDTVLRHRVCGKVFDPALEIVRNERSAPGGPHMPNVEYRDAMTGDDGT